MISRGDVSRGPNRSHKSNCSLTLAVDYNSWIESDQGRKLRETLDEDVVLAEGKDAWSLISLASH